MIYPPPLFTQNIISTQSPEVLGFVFPFSNLTFPSAAAWGTAKLVIYLPLTIFDAITITKLGIFNGTTVAGNHDLGIYDGVTLGKIVSTGSVARTGNGSLLQVTTITTTTLQAGFYFLASTLSAATDTVVLGTLSAAVGGAAHGIREETTGSFGLPSTMTPTIPATGNVPWVALERTGFPS
jgi:hypothetical protein